jgi:outer membrane protein assembly factor BamB
MRIGLLAGIGILTIVGGSAILAQQKDSYPSAGEWRQWGGPQRNFHSPVTGLADSWPESGPPVLWSRPLGVGHSTIVVDDGRLFTMYRVGGAGRNGPWAPEEFVIAMDAASGKTLWEYKYPSQPMNFSYGAGPHSTPTVVGDRVFATGTNKQIHAFNKRTGEVLWSIDLVKQYGAPPALVRAPVKAGYACSLLAYNDTLICQVGGPGQAVMAFRQSDGSVAWKSGDFLVSEASPILINVDGEEQVVIFAGQAVHGLAPATGQILWSHPHDTDSDMNNSTPIWGADNMLIVSSAYNQGTRAIRLSRKEGKTVVEPLWFSNRLRLMFANALRLGDHIYGSNGDFGPSFVTAVNVKTGETVWQERGFGRSSFLSADGKVIIIDEDGDLVLARLSPEKMTVLAQAPIFKTMSWTAPTLVGTTLYARDREKILALDLGKR